MSLRELITHLGIPVLLNTTTITPKPYSKNDKIPCEAHAKYLERFTQWLKGQRYSEKTIRTYTDAISVFLKFTNHKLIETIDNKDVALFNYDYVLKNNYSISYQNQIINAIKLFFRIIENKTIITEELERPQRPQKLPDVLSKEEIQLILTATTNLKRKAILTLVYSCSLRRSELLNITPQSINSGRGLLIIKGGKGNKDRIAPLSGKVVNLLRVYYKSAHTVQFALLFNQKNKYAEKFGSP